MIILSNNLILNYDRREYIRPYTWVQQEWHHPKRQAFFYASIGPSPLPLIPPLISSAYSYSLSSLHKHYLNHHNQWLNFE